MTDEDHPSPPADRAGPDAGAAAIAELLAAHRARAAFETLSVVVAVSEFAQRGTVVRFLCPRRCGWAHEEPADPGPMSLVLPGPDGADFADMMGLNAEARQLALRARVEDAVTSHCLAAH